MEPSWSSGPESPLSSLWSSLLQEVKGLQNQIANSGLTVELDAPKSQDLSKIMADIRAQYEELAKKNREELDKYWSQQVHEGKGWVQD